MADDPFDALYRVRPDEFTALRAQLAAEAKQAGDAAAAKRIGAARKPTVAAWIVNQLADGDTRARLTDLGERLRDAHAQVDPQRIRALSVEQRGLVDELARTAFQRAGIADPAAALRDDVTGTVQAAIADPDVTAQLGRLTKAERWSGFGGFGGAAPVLTVVPGGRAIKAPSRTKRPQPAPEAPPDDDEERDLRAEVIRAAEADLRTADATLAAAEQGKSEADDEVTERQASLAAARLRHRDAEQRLREAQRRLDEAEQSFADAKAAARDAAELVSAAKQQQKQRRTALAKARR
ncbi:MAG: hypothetical protein ACTHMS_06145 [Jatrophihabitans sp.]|uniref:hypothetical protein n=1 Tax=Jatrophihabitans sp. TaxID=1932789 RepID=UPI003F81BA1A